MTEIRFKNFIPKDEDLRPLWQEGVSVAGRRRALEKEFQEAVDRAKKVQVSKTALRPEWDLKRTYVTRNKQLATMTNRAIAKLSGTADTAMDTEEGPFGDVQLPESAEKLSFIHHEELSDDEEADFLATKRFTGSITRADIGRDEYDGDEK